MRIKKNIKVAAAALFMSGVVALNASALVSRSNQINELTIEQQNYISTIEEMQETIGSYEDIIANLQAELNEAQSELDNKSSIMSKNKANNNIPGYNVNQNHAPQNQNAKQPKSNKLNTNGFKNNAINNLINKNKKKQ